MGRVSEQLVAPPGLLPICKPEAKADTIGYAPQGLNANNSLHVYCLAVLDCTSWANKISKGMASGITGLILLPLQDQPSTYCRAGLFALANIDMKETDPTILAAGKQNLSWFENADYQTIMLV